MPVRDIQFHGAHYLHGSHCAMIQWLQLDFQEVSSDPVYAFLFKSYKNKSSLDRQKNWRNNQNISTMQIYHVWTLKAPKIIKRDWSIWSTKSNSNSYSFWSFALRAKFLFKKHQAISTRESTSCLIYVYACTKLKLVFQVLYQCLVILKIVFHIIYHLNITSSDAVITSTKKRIHKIKLWNTDYNTTNYADCFSRKMLFSSEFFIINSYPFSLLKVTLFYLNFLQFISIKRTKLSLIHYHTIDRFSSKFVKIRVTGNITQSAFNI